MGHDLSKSASMRWERETSWGPVGHGGVPFGGVPYGGLGGGGAVVAAAADTERNVWSGG